MVWRRFNEEPPRRIIAARTERYGCPIKHARRTIGAHSRYAHFLDYGDPEDFHAIQARLRPELACKECRGPTTTEQA